MEDISWTSEYEEWKDKRRKEELTFGTWFVREKEKAPITWKILDKWNNNLLVISKYALESRPYHDTYEEVTWEDSDLRKWLNGDFLNTAFTEKEQAMIPTVTVWADKNPSYPFIHSGSNTEDRVFLPSIDDIIEYFDDNDLTKCIPFEYARGKEPPCESNWWWLRTPGGYRNGAARVDGFGSIHFFGIDVDTDEGWVRPALWIKLPDMEKQDEN